MPDAASLAPVPAAPTITINATARGEARVAGHRAAAGPDQSDCPPAQATAPPVASPIGGGFAISPALFVFLIGLGNNETPEERALRERQEERERFREIEDDRLRDRRLHHEEVRDDQDAARLLQARVDERHREDALIDARQARRPRREIAAYVSAAARTSEMPERQLAAERLTVREEGGAEPHRGDRLDLIA